MSDQPQGMGWWQASDGKWYPPAQAPGPQAPVAPPAPPTGPPPPGMAYPAGSYPPGYASAQQQRGMSGCAKAAIVVAVLAFLLGGGCVVALLVFGEDVAREAVDNVDAARRNGREDTDLVGCERDADGRMVASIEISNGSSGTSRYNVVVSFLDEDGVVVGETASVSVSGVAPGDERTVEARSVDLATQDLECRIEEAFRFADGPGD